MPTLVKLLKKRTVKNPMIRGIYNTKMWVNLRKSYLMEHPLCEKCLETGLTKLAKEVHHKIPISLGQDELKMKDLAYDYNNLMSLCIDCHHKLHNEMRK